MTIKQPVSEFFTAGGTLPPDAPSYVKRQTDDELYRHIMTGEFCYVLTPRQMGKSSLMIRTVQRLLNAGVKSAIVDLTQIGTVESEAQWYKGILTQIKRRLKLTIDPVTWWQRRKDIPNIQKFIEFFEEALSEVEEHIVIFIDEIDTTLKLDYRDDFFAGIRAMFNARAENPDFERITFVLLGVASPSDLIKDRNRTPFNIGQEISLRPFSREDAHLLEKGLNEEYPEFGRQILDRIFYWTNGHPYLTQKLCQSAVEDRLKECSDTEIDLIVKRLFISEEASRETNLQFVRENILSYPERRVILSLYKRLLRGVEVRDNKNSLSQNYLRLSGLTRVEDGRLVVSNKIYREVFDQRWVNKYSEVDWRYFIIGTLSLLIIAFAPVFYNDGVRLPNQAATRVNGIPIYYGDDRGIQYLADLFRMKPLVFANGYEYRAKDTFFNSISSWEEQKELMEIEYGPSLPSPENYKIVVVGLYTSLADVDNSGDTTRLLEVMYKSLMKMGMQKEGIYREIDYWLKARESSSQNDPEQAITLYTNAININPQNPSTLFERARIYARQGEFELALKDYDRVIGIVPESNVEPTSIPASERSVVTNTPSGTVPPTATLILTKTLTSIPAIQQTITPGVSIAATLPTALSPTAASLLPIQPRFLTLGQRSVAVTNDIKQNENLSFFLLKADQADYPNLVERGLIPLVVPTATPTAPDALVSPTQIPPTRILATQIPSTQMLPTQVPLTPDTSILGGKLVFDSPVNSGWQVFSINPDGSELKQLTDIPNGTGDPAISPDGQSIVFLSEHATTLSVMNADGTQVRNVYHTDIEVGWPSWSFDSQKILFAAKINGYKNLYMMNADGSNVRQLTDISADDLSPSLSPDGSQVLFTSNRSGTWEIYKLFVLSGEVIKLTNLGDPVELWPAWSPDGSRIAFEASGIAGQRDIFTMYSDGSQIENITNSSTYDGAPVWSPTGEEIAFASSRDGGLDIYIMENNGQQIRRLTTIWAWGPSWSFVK